MARLTLQLEGSPSKEFGIGSSITIGRLPDNAIVIDNPAVSSHHACVFRDGESFVLEDLQSTNGTFVDGKRISRSRLKDDDVIVIGNEKLTFNERLTGSVTEAPAATTDEITTQTVFVDADRYINDESLGYWLAHELGHLATNSAKEDDAERVAKGLRRRLKDSRHENLL